MTTSALLPDRCRRRGLGAGIALVLTLGAAGAKAAEREVRGSVATQVNPAGLRADLGVAWKWGLFRSTNPLFKDAHVAVGITDQLSPAYDRLEGWIELSPLSILDLRAGVEGFGYFGTFGHLVGFPSYDSDFSEDARKALSDRAVARVGRRFYASPALQFRAGRVSFRLAAAFEWWKVRNAPGEVFYEALRSTLLDANGDQVVSGSNVFFYDVSRARTERVRVGLYHDYVNVWDAPQNRNQRLGPILALKLGERRFGGRDPVLYAGVLHYLEAPDRNGVSAFVALTLSFGKEGQP